MSDLLAQDENPNGEQPKRKVFSRTLKFVLLAAVVYFFVLPLLPVFWGAVHDLKSIDPNLLFVGFALQGLAVFAYSMLTRTALGEHREKISALRLYRIQLSTKALGNIVPGGSAASSALGYRLITMCGIPGPDAAFALATAGIGSAVVLNMILWVGLVVSIPARGVNPVYGAAALAGVLLMAFAAFVIFGLVEGQGRSERIVRSFARRFKFDEHHAAKILAHLGARIEGLAKERGLLWRVFGWALINWMLDALSLWVFIRAFGGNVGMDGLLVAFGLANVFSVIPITPGGLGIVEGIYIPTLVGFGLAQRVATVGVLSYRVAQYWLPIVVGWACYLSLRYGPFAIDRKHRLQTLPQLAASQTERGLNTVDWVEKFAPRDRTGQFPMPRFEPGDLEFGDDDTNGSPKSD